MSDDPFFDAMPKAAPDEWGAWSKAKPQGFRDVFPTPEAFRAAAERFARSGPHEPIGAMLAARGPRFVGVLTEDGVAMVDLDGLEAEFARAIEEMKR